MTKKGYTYILFNKRKGTLYTGVTSNLKKRITEHKEKKYDGFSKKYETDKLGYFEEHPSTVNAIEREKKKMSRAQKLRLIESTNPFWKDLFFDLF